jgi:hypothetical protein
MDVQYFRDMSLYAYTISCIQFLFILGKKYNFYLQSATRKSWNFKVFVYNLYKQLQVESVKRAYICTNISTLQMPKILTIRK